MKRIIMTITAMLTLALSMSGCIAKENVERDETEAGAWEATENGQETTYDFDNFSDISLSGIVHAFIKQGDRYDIRVVESTNPKLKTYVEKKGNTLHVYTKSKGRIIGNSDSPKVYVTMPSISGLEASGATKSTISSLKTDDMAVNLSGASAANFGDMKCEGLHLNCSGAAKLSFGKVKCESLRGRLSGATNLTLAANVSNDIDIENTGACKQNLKLTGKTFKMDNAGASSSEISFKGISANVSCSGAGKMQLNVDCEELKASNNGASKFTISGTADKTDIDASGVAKIDTKQLNKL